MSGGYFDYQQYKIEEMADQIERAIKTNEVADEYGYARNYSPQTIQEFEKAAKALRLAFVYAHRIDLLLSGDDGEDCFARRLKEELEIL